MPTRLNRISLIVVTLVSTSTAVRGAAEPEKPDQVATVPIGINGIPRQDQVGDASIAEEFQLGFFTTTFQWKEPLLLFSPICKITLFSDVLFSFAHS